MEPPTGLDIAKVLVSLESPPVVIFATKSNAYALKGYGVAIRYLQKPICQPEFFEAVDAAIADATAHRLTFQLDSMLISVHLRDVQYIESFGHYTVIHTSQDQYRLRSTLKDISSRLPKGYFAAPHKSYIVNLEHIRSASTSEVTLDCGVVIPIGRKRTQEFNNALYRFWGGKYVHCFRDNSSYCRSCACSPLHERFFSHKRPSLVDIWGVLYNFRWHFGVPIFFA